MIGLLVKFLKALNSNSNPSEIAHALSIGIMLGLMPKSNALWYILFVFFMFVRINKGWYCVVTLLVSQIAWMLDPLFHDIGWTILHLEALEKFFSVWIEIPFVGFTRFNNTIVIGSFALSLVLYIPFYILGIVIVKVWRKHVAPFFVKTPLAKFVASLPVIGKLIGMLEEKVQ